MLGSIPFDYRYSNDERKLRFQTNHFKLFIPYKQRRKIENSRTCDICNIDVHRASFAKHFRNKKHLENEIFMENEKQNDVIIPEWFFQEPIENFS